MFNFFSQSMHVTNAYVILFLESAKTGDRDDNYLWETPYEASGLK